MNELIATKMAFAICLVVLFAVSLSACEMKTSNHNSLDDEKIVTNDDTGKTSEIESVDIYDNEDEIIEFKEYIGAVAVVMDDVQLKTPYIFTIGDDNEGKQHYIYETLNENNSNFSVKKGDLVIVIEEKESICRVTPISIGDPSTIRGYIESKNISYDMKDISNANQCCFTDIISYNDNGDELDKISGRSQIYERKNGKCLISMAGGGENRWVNEKDVNYCIDTELTDIVVNSDYHYSDE